jgi:hypothetical protein
MPKNKLKIDASSTGEPNPYIHPGLLEELATFCSCTQSMAAKAANETGKPKPGATDGITRLTPPPGKLTPPVVQINSPARQTNSPGRAMQRSE